MCPHWNNGACGLGLYGGRPSPGVCRQCEHAPDGLASSYIVKSGTHWREEFAGGAYLDITLNEDVVVSGGSCYWSGSGAGHGIIGPDPPSYDKDTTIEVVLTLGYGIYTCRWNIHGSCPDGGFAVPLNFKLTGTTPVGNYVTDQIDGPGHYVSTGTVE